jgi:hypothetical protein
MDDLEREFSLDDPETEGGDLPTDEDLEETEDDEEVADLTGDEESDSF